MIITCSLQWQFLSKVISTFRFSLMCSMYSTSNPVNQTLHLLVSTSQTIAEAVVNQLDQINVQIIAAVHPIFKIGHIPSVFCMCSGRVSWNMLCMLDGYVFCGVAVLSPREKQARPSQDITIQVNWHWQFYWIIQPGRKTWYLQSLQDSQEEPQWDESSQDLTQLQHPTNSTFGVVVLFVIV